MPLTSLDFIATEACPPCVAAWLTSLRVSQVAFAVILLFPFREHERSTALRTRDFKVWHRGFSTRMKSRTFILLLFGALALRFFQPLNVERKRCFYKRTPKSWRPDGYVACECTPAMRSIQLFLTETVADDLHARCSLWRISNTDHALALIFARHMRCSSISRTKA